MRRADHIRQAEQHIFLRGLDLVHVEGGAGDTARFNGFGKVRLDHKATARAVDDAHAFFHRRDRLCVDNVLGLLGERRVKGDEIGAAEEFLEADALDAEVDCALVGKERVIADDLHSEAVRAVGDDGADVAAADDAERLGRDFDAHEARLLPLASLRRAVGLGDLPGERHHQRDGVLRRRDGIAEGRVHHDDAAAGGDRNIDIVDADACAADHLEARRLGENLLADLGGGPDREAVIPADDFRKLFLVETDFRVGLNAAILEDLGGGGRKFVCDKNARGCHYHVS